MNDKTFDFGKAANEYTPSKPEDVAKALNGNGIVIVAGANTDDVKEQLKALGHAPIALSSFYGTHRVPSIDNCILDATAAASQAFSAEASNGENVIIVIGEDITDKYPVPIRAYYLSRYVLWIDEYGNSFILRGQDVPTIQRKPCSLNTLVKDDVDA